MNSKKMFFLMLFAFVGCIGASLLSSGCGNSPTDPHGSKTATPTETVMVSPTLTATSTSTGTETDTQTATATATASATPTETSTPSVTATVTETATVTSTPETHTISFQATSSTLSTVDKIITNTGDGQEPVTYLNASLPFQVTLTSESADSVRVDVISSVSGNVSLSWTNVDQSGFTNFQNADPSTLTNNDLWVSVQMSNP